MMEPHCLLLWSKKIKKQGNKSWLVVFCCLRNKLLLNRDITSKVITNYRLSENEKKLFMNKIGTLESVSLFYISKQLSTDICKISASSSQPKGLI